MNTSQSSSKDRRLSSRWTAPESDSPACNSYRHNDKGQPSGGSVGSGIHTGDVSSWSRATSKPFGSQFKPIRPEVGRGRNQFSPIRSIKALVAFQEAKARLISTHNPKSIVAPSNSGKREVEKAIKDCEKTIQISEARVAAPSFINDQLFRLTKKGGVVKEYK